MCDMNGYNILVVRGGPSEEHEVSMKTGAALLRSLENGTHTLRDVIISRGGQWILDGRIVDPEHIVVSADVVLLGLHGEYGEDGKIQQILERHAVSYTGSDSFSSAVAMHKGLTKERLAHANIKCAPHIVIRREDVRSVSDVVDGVTRMFSGPYVVKPAASGSSHGIAIAANSIELSLVLERALENYESIMIEKFIRGREATCGVIERFRGEDMYALPPIEIIPADTSDFFDYEAKYSGASQEVCPGRFSESEKAEIVRMAKLVHEALNLSQYSRSDFIIADDGIYFLEVNTLPGLTETSLIPCALQAVGSSLSELVHHLVEDALSIKR